MHMYIYIYIYIHGDRCWRTLWMQVLDFRKGGGMTYVCVWEDTQTGGRSLSEYACTHLRVYVRTYVYMHV